MATEVKITLTADGTGLKVVTDGAQAQFVKLGESAKDASAQATSGIDGVRQKLDQMRASAVNVVQVLAGIFVVDKVVEMAKEMALLNARYETLGVAMTVVGKNSGYTGVQMEAAALGMQKMGISMVESRQQAMRLVQAHIDLAESQKLARIAQDAAVIGNMNSSDTFAAMIHGISTGQTDVLRTIGLNVSMEQSYKIMADTLGKNVNMLTQNERTQGVLNAVMLAGTDIAGTYEAAMDTAGKQINSMKRYTDDLKTVQGEVFNEVLTVAVMAYTSHLKDSNAEMKALAASGELKAWGLELAAVFVGVANAIDNMLNMAKMAGTWAAHQGAAAKISDGFTKKKRLLSIFDTEGYAKIQAEEKIALEKEQVQYEAYQVDRAKSDDRVQNAWDERQKTTADKASKALADTAATESERSRIMAYYQAERDKGLLSMSSYVKVMNAFTQANYGDNHVYKDTSPAAKSEKGPASAYDGLNDGIARNLALANEEMLMGDKLNAADKQREQEIVKVTQAFVQGKITELQWSDLYDKAVAASTARRNADSSNYISSLLNEARKVGLSTQALKEMEIAKRAAADPEFSDRILEAGKKLEEAYASETFKKMLAEMTKQGDAEVTALEKSIGAQQLHNAEIGKTKEQIELVKQARDDAYTAQLVQDDKTLASAVQMQGVDKDVLAIWQARLDIIRREVPQRQQLSQDQGTGAALQGVSDAQTELSKFLDPSKAQSFGDALKGAFNSAGNSLGKLINTLDVYGIKQAEIEKARKDANIAYAGDASKLASANLQITEIERKNQMSAYADMAGAAKGFFDEKSSGYKLMSAAEQAFRTLEMAMAVESMVKKLFFTTATTTAAVTGNALTAASSVAGAAIEVPAKMAIASANAIAGVANQANGDPYSAFPRMALMAGIMVALGLAVGSFGGGGGGSGTAHLSAADQQKQQGSGTVLGDSTAQSKSIADSLAILSKNSFEDLDYSNSMLSALNSISNNIASLSDAIAKTLGVSGGMFDTNKLGLGDVKGSAGSNVRLLEGTQFLAGTGLGKLQDRVANWVFGGDQSTTLSDQGIQFGRQTVGQASRGVTANTYQDLVTKTDGGLFGRDHTDFNTVTGKLNADVTRWLTQTIASLGEGVAAVAGTLGIKGAKETIDAMQLGLSRISLSGMNGEQIGKSLSGVMGATFDKMAIEVMPGVLEFAKIGEGAGVTLVRLAKDYQTVDFAMITIGKTFATVGVESIKAREALIEASGGMDNFASQAKDFSKNYLSEAERTAITQTAVTAEMTRLGYASVTTREQFKTLVQGIDVTTPAGAKLYAELMNVQSGFASVTTSAVEAGKAFASVAGSLRSAIDAVNGNSAVSDNAARLTAAATLAAVKQAMPWITSIAQLTTMDTSPGGDFSRYSDANRTLIIDAVSAAGVVVKLNLQIINSAFSAVERAVSAEKTRIGLLRNAASESINSIKGVFGLLKDQVSQLWGTVSSTAAMKLAQGNAFIDDALVVAKSTGSMPDQIKLADAIAGVRSGLDANNYTSQFEADKATLVLAGKLSRLQDIGGDQLTAAELALKAYDDQLTALDGIMTAAQAQIDAVNGVNASVMTVAAAVAQLGAAMAAEKAVTPSSPVTGGTGSGGATNTGGFSGVQGGGQATGGKPSDAVLADYLGQVHEMAANPMYARNVANDVATRYAGLGVTQADIARVQGKSEADVAAWFDAYGVSRFAQGGAFTNGIVSRPTNFDIGQMGEAGHEAIMPLANIGGSLGVRAVISGAGNYAAPDNADVVAELRQGREENRAQARVIAQLLSDLRKLQKDWDGNGLPATRVLTPTAVPG